MREPRYDLDPTRTGLYYTGLIIAVIGFLIFLSTSFTFAAKTALCGMVVLIAGNFLMKLGRDGPAGSGLLLDPRQARRDMEPWSRSAGGMIDDALSEVQSLKPPDHDDSSKDDTPAIKIRCRSCKALNDEHAKFCNQCAKPID